MDCVKGKNNMVIVKPANREVERVTSCYDKAMGWPMANGHGLWSMVHGPFIMAVAHDGRFLRYHTVRSHVSPAKILFEVARALLARLLSTLSMSMY